MTDLFCDGCKAKNNEEYRLVLKKRQRRYWYLFCAGLLTAALGAVLEAIPEERISGRQTAFVLGLGSGLCLGSALIIWNIRRVMKNEDQLKERRLKEVDEREIEVRSRALQAAAKALMVMLYVLSIIGGLFVRELTWVCGLLIFGFLVSFALFQKYYGKKL